MKEPVREEAETTAWIAPWRELPADRVPGQTAEWEPGAHGPGALGGRSSFLQVLRVRGQRAVVWPERPCADLGSPMDLVPGRQHMSGRQGKKGTVPHPRGLCSQMREAGYTKKMQGLKPLSQTPNVTGRTRAEQSHRG